ncbi:hypothetical protein [Zobellia laminariae]|uniref:hypothetical protein n=1 Tax=Zobellia laminariae TaxID=248906 RepID=UPI0026F42CE8|nr:hypothetical protein [Zobellia laminariae]WKX78322.1 hypothetical protein Q5W13_10755 [Zobellia laminariae]
MKNLTMLLIVLLLSFPKYSNAQNDGAVVAGAVGALVAIGASVAAVEQMKERAELTATEWLLANNPRMTSFSLKTLDFDGKKLKDMSSASLITFKIQEFMPMDQPELNGIKQVLLGFTSHGWINEYGIDFTKVQWFLIDRTEWVKMMVAYVKTASDEKNENKVEGLLTQGKILNRGIKVKNKAVIPFYRLSGDMYVVVDYSDAMKFIYNERSLGIFLKETRDLVQIKRSSLIEIHEFFFKNN